MAHKGIVLFKRDLRFSVYTRTIANESAIPWLKYATQSLNEHVITSCLLALESGGHGLNGYKGPMWDSWQKEMELFL
jgi:hypothetical protein